MRGEHTAPLQNRANGLDQPKWAAWRLPVLALTPMAGAAWWLVGFLPWIAGGMSRPVGSSYSGQKVVHLAVPLFAESLSLLAIDAVLGGIVAGLLARAARGRLRVRAAAVTVGVAVAVVLTLIQSRHAIGAGRTDSFAADSRVLDGLCFLVVVGAASGVALGLLGNSGTLGLGVAAGAVAGSAPVWLISLFNGAVGADQGLFRLLTEISQWTGAALLALALFTIGHRPKSRALAWPLVVVFVWLVGPTVTALTYLGQLLRSGAGLPASLPEHLSATIQVWTEASSPAARPLIPWVTAAIVAVALSAWKGRKLSTVQKSDE